MGAADPGLRGFVRLDRICIYQCLPQDLRTRFPRECGLFDRISIRHFLFTEDGQATEQPRKPCSETASPAICHNATGACISVSEHIGSSILDANVSYNFSMPLCQMEPKTPRRYIPAARVTLVCAVLTGSYLCKLFVNPCLRLSSSLGSRTVPGNSRRSRTGMLAVLEPPTRNAPPEIVEPTQDDASAWAECIIEECDSEGCRRMENWVFRKEHATDYQAFLNVRNVKPQGFLPYHGQTNFNTTVFCKERGVDVSLSCAECVRLIIGGPYGARGVAVAAFPAQDSVLPCLELSQFLPITKPKTGERWDGNQEIPRQTAFCNVLSLGM